MSDRTKKVKLGFFGMLGKCKVLSNPMELIKLRQVIVFPYVIDRYQKKFWFLNSRIAGRGVDISQSASVSDMTLFHMV